MSQLELLDAQRSELADRRAAVEVQELAVPGDGRPRARPGWRMAGAVMNEKPPDLFTAGPLLGLAVVILAILILALA